MQDERPPSVHNFESGLLEGLREPTKDLLVQMLLYKSVFTGRTFRMLAQREEPPEVREALELISRETLTETAAVAIRMRQWDRHPVAWDAIEECIQQARRRLLEDFLRLKEGMAEVGLLIAMRAPSDELRVQLVKLADVDRRHADRFRGLLGSNLRAEGFEAAEPAASAEPLGAHEGRAGAGSLRAAVERAIEAIRQRGAEPTRVRVSADGARHLRDEGAIDPVTGQAFGLFLDIDMGWRGESFAVDTQERIGYAELLTAARAREADEARRL